MPIHSCACGKGACFLRREPRLIAGAGIGVARSQILLFLHLQQEFRGGVSICAQVLAVLNHTLIVRLAFDACSMRQPNV